MRRKIVIETSPYTEEEQERQMSRSEVPYNALKAIANNILDFGKITGEYSQNSQSIQALDTEMWAGISAPAKDSKWFNE